LGCCFGAALTRAALLSEDFIVNPDNVKHDKNLLVRDQLSRRSLFTLPSPSPPLATPLAGN